MKHTTFLIDGRFILALSPGTVFAILVSSYYENKYFKLW